MLDTKSGRGLLLFFAGLLSVTSCGGHGVGRPPAKIEQSLGSSMGADEAGSAPVVARGKMMLLYLTRFGERDQLRMRVFPYPGSEEVLWESAGAKARTSYLPSPSWTHVAITYTSPHTAYPNSHVLIAPLGGTGVERLQYDAEFVLWRDDDTLLMIEPRGREWAYDLRTDTREIVAQHSDALECLKAAFAGPIETVSELARKGALPVALQERDRAVAVLRSVGLPRVLPLIPPMPAPMPVAALSPDGRYLALTAGGPGGAVFVTALVRSGAPVREAIALTELVKGEIVWAEDLRWSPDSQHLTFTEVHFHPARPHRPGRRSDGPDPLDWTYLVRMYSADTRKTETLAVGRSGFLLPSSPDASGKSENTSTTTQGGSNLTSQSNLFRHYDGLGPIDMLTAFCGE